jgi:hypothetical protein
MDRGNGSADRYPYVSDIRSSVVQVDVGVSRFAAILLFVTSLVSASALIGLLFTMSALKTVSAKYEVLQYDHQALKAQLVARGLYEGTEH